ncbi:hypothetical protein D3C72_2479520 [compost metagenome]
MQVRFMFFLTGRTLLHTTAQAGLEGHEFPSEVRSTDKLFPELKQRYVPDD